MDSNNKSGKNLDILSSNLASVTGGAQSSEPLGLEAKGVAVAIKICMTPGLNQIPVVQRSVQSCLRSPRSSGGIATPCWLDGPGYADWCPLPHSPLQWVQGPFG